MESRLNQNKLDRVREGVDPILLIRNRLEEGGAKEGICNSLAAFRLFELSIGAETEINLKKV